MRPVLERAINATNSVLERIFGLRVTLSKGTFDQVRKLVPDFDHQAELMGLK